MIRDILYLIVYFITETVLYSLAYRTVLSRGITNKAVRWMIYIIAVVITGSIVYVNNNLQYVMGASIFIMVMLPVFIIEPFEIQNLILYPFVVIASSIFGMLFFKMSKKHTKRIMGYEATRPFWHFFDLKAYIIMACMMGGGIGFRAAGIFPDIFIAFFYSGLGCALA